MFKKGAIVMMLLPVVLIFLVVIAQLVAPYVFNHLQ